MKLTKRVHCVLLIFALAALSSCGGNSAVTSTSAEIPTQTIDEMTTGAVTATTKDTTVTPMTTEPTTSETTAETTVLPISEDYDKLGRGIDVISCEYKELKYSTDIDDPYDNKSRLINEFLRGYVLPERYDDFEDYGYSGVEFGGYTSYDFDCDGKEEYIIRMSYTTNIGMPYISCQLFYMEDDGSSWLLHGAAYSLLNLWDFGGLVLFEVHPDHTNGIYGGDSRILRAYDGEEPLFVFSSHGDDTCFVEESGYIYDYVGHMYGPYYAVVTPDREFLWITRDDLTTDELMECAKTDTFITEWLNEQNIAKDDILEAFTIGHLDYCLRVKDEREHGSWYTLSDHGAWQGMQTYISEDNEYYIGKQAKTVHGIDLKKLNIIE